MKHTCFARLLLTLVILVAVPAVAQDTAILAGRVQDSSGAVVAGAKVTIVNTATNVQDASQTNDEGLYRVPALRPGIYRVTVTAAGFKSFVRENVELRVGVTVPINADLEVGATSESVNVTATTPLLEPETSTTGTIVEGNFFYRMPLWQGRSAASFYFTPGVMLAGLGNAGSLGTFTVNGEPTTRLGLFEDAMSIVAPDASNYIETMTSTIAELKVITTVLPAEYGHSAGGGLVVVKKSGTNDLHGFASNIGRTRSMAHRYFFDQYKSSQSRPDVGLPNGEAMIATTPEGHIEGPIYIPKIYNGRNKTFFMFGYRWLTQKEGLSQPYDVPTLGELNGNFSFPEHPAGVTIYPIFDSTTTTLTNGVWTRSPFPGNIIPKNRFDPVATKFLALNPFTPPDTGGSWTSTGPSSNLASQTQKRTFQQNYTLRLDHQLTQDLKIFATWTRQAKWAITPNVNIANPILDNANDKTVNVQQTGSIGATWVPSPTLVSETRINYYRYVSTVASVAYGLNWGTMLGIPNIGTDSMPNGLPIYNGNPSFNARENFNFREDVSKMVRTHALKMGYDLVRWRLDSHTADNSAGSFSFMGTNGLNANGSSTPGTGGASIASFLVGAASSYSRTITTFLILPRDWIHSLYIQDDWKVTPSLTANLGLRYSVESPPNNKYGLNSTFTPMVADNTDIGLMGVIAHPTGSMYNKDWNNFQPRIGLAWQALKNTVVRAGFAVNTVDNHAVSPPTTEYGSNTATWTQPSGNYFPLFMISSGPDWTKFGYGATRADGSVPFTGANYSSRTATWVNPDNPNPYTMNWNFNIQQGLGSNYVLDLIYTGDRGLKSSESWSVNSLPYSYAWNMYQTNPTQFSSMVGNSQPFRPWINFGTISYQGHGATSTFHSGTIKIEKRYSRGLTFSAFYTYGKCISANTGSPYLDRGEQRARCSFDRTHDFTSSMNYEIPIGKGRKFMNRGGVLNAIFGGYDMVWTYAIETGNPLTFGMGGTLPQYMPGIVATIGGRPNSTGQSAHLRSNWQDIGGDRWTQTNQHKMIDSMSDFTIPAAYTMGSVGGYTMDAQRYIAANFSASKQWKIKERMTFVFRYDFQNPFKWYNWGGPNTTVNFTNPINTFGTVTPSWTTEASTANYGGTPMQDISLQLKF